MSAATKNLTQQAVSDAARDAARDMRASDPASTPAQPDTRTAVKKILDSDTAVAMLASAPAQPDAATPAPVSAPAPAGTPPAPGATLSNGAPVPEGWTVCDEPGRAGFYDEQGRYRWPSGKLYWAKSGDGMPATPRTPRLPTNGGSTERRVTVTERALYDLATTLQAEQARCEQALSDPASDPDRLADASATLANVATRLITLINPLKARLPELEILAGDTEIALAEAQLILARSEATLIRARRSGEGDVDALAQIVKDAASEVERCTRERNNARVDLTRASR